MKKEFYSPNKNREKIGRSYLIIQSFNHKTHIHISF
jgi:hypothetical protein